MRDMHVLIPSQEQCQHGDIDPRSSNAKRFDVVSQKAKVDYTDNLSGVEDELHRLSVDREPSVLHVP